MKTIKYLFIGAVLTLFCSPVSAQDGTKADVAAVVKLINSKPADIAKEMKPYYAKNKKNPENLVEFGKAFLAVKDLENARAVVDFAMKGNSKYAPLYVLKGDIAAHEDNGGDAAANYEQAIFYDKTLAEAYRKYALIYSNVSLPVALEKLEDMRVNCPDYPVDALIAHINYTKFKYNAAAEAYSRVPLTQLSKRDVAEYTYCLYRAKKYDQALGVINKALQNDALNPTLNRLALYCSVEKKNTAEAKKYADVLFNKIDKDSVNLSHTDYEKYASALTQDSLYEQAIDKYNEGLKLEVENESEKSGLYMGLSDTYKAMKDYDNAIDYYNRYMSVIEKDDHTENDFANLGMLYFLNARLQEEGSEARINSYKKADEYFVSLLNFPGTEEYCYYQRARTAVGLDPDMSQGLAKPLFEKLVELIIAHEKLDNTDKSRLENSYRYLMAYEVAITKDKEKALEFAKKVQELRPDDESIARIIEMYSK